MSPCYRHLSPCKPYIFRIRFLGEILSLLLHGHASPDIDAAVGEARVHELLPIARAILAIRRTITHLRIE